MAPDGKRLMHGEVVLDGHKFFVSDEFTTEEGGNCQTPRTRNRRKRKPRRRQRKADLAETLDHKRVLELQFSTNRPILNSLRQLGVLGASAVTFPLNHRREVAETLQRDFQWVTTNFRPKLSQ